MDECVELSLPEASFLQRLKKAAALDEQEAEAVTEETRGLYRQIRSLHDEGMNGVWARIIKNNFAPLFLEPCDYIVGNPPWVNWEHLPDDYRRSTMPLWQHYELFPKRENAMDTILGAAKYDLSMLMTYVAADQYLRPNGKLGFVLTLSLFKTAAAGQGFRKFALPGGLCFGPLTPSKGFNRIMSSTTRRIACLLSNLSRTRFNSSAICCLAGISNSNCQFPRSIPLIHQTLHSCSDLYR